MILPVLKTAKAVFEKAGVSADANFQNGSVALGAMWNNRYSSFDHTLRFSPDQEKRQAVCSSSFEGEEDEPFTLDRLSEATVQAKVKRFAYLVARGEQAGGPHVTVL